MKKTSKNQLMKYYNSQASCQILGCLMNNPSIIQKKEYNLNPEDFMGERHILLFTCVYNLVQQGLKKISIGDIETYLATNDLKGHDLLFNNEQNFEWLDKVYEDASISNFEYYYGLVRKMSLLRAYLEENIDVRSILDMDEIDHIIIKNQNEKFDLMTIEDIKSYFDRKIINIKRKFNGRDEESKRKSGEGGKELRKMLKEAPNYGFNLESGYLNTITRGALTKKFFLETRDSGCVDCDTEFFNGHEWKKISEFNKDDQVLQYNEDGTTTLVRPLNYIKNKQNKLWHFETKYGLNQCLSDEHNVIYLNKGGKLKNIKFKDLKENHNNTTNGFRGKFITTFKYNGQGINLSEFEIRLMCAVICDGTFKHEFANKNLCRINIKKQRKKDRLEWILNELKINYRKEQWNPNDLNYNNYIFEVPRIEKEFGEFWYNCSNEQLRIICDEILYWDGSQCNNRKSFSTTNKDTADFVQFAFSSFGKKATICTIDRVGQKHSTQDYTYKSIEYTVVISDRTLLSIMNYDNKVKINEYQTKDGYEYCFTVPSHMLVLRRENKIFITGNCGKTRVALKRLTSICSPYLWDFKTQGYIKNPNGINNSGLYIGTEMDLYEELEPILWSVITGIEEDRIRANDLTKEEDERLDKAIEYAEEMQLYMEDESNYDLTYLTSTIESYKEDYNICAVAIDYLELTSSLTSEYVQLTKGMTAREDQVLLNLSKAIKDLAKKYSVTIFGFTQTTDEARSLGYRDQRAVKGARSLPNKCDVGITVFEPTEKELELIRPLIPKRKGLKDTNLPINSCYTIYKNRGGKYKDIKIWGNNNLGNGRFVDFFCTNKYYEPINIEETFIELEE